MASDWTVDTAIKYLEGRIQELDKLIAQRFADNDKAIQAALLAAKEAVTAALAAAKEAVEKANSASEKRFDAVNEFRNQQKDIIATFLPRNEYEANHKAIEEKLQDLTDRMNTSSGKSSGTSATVAYIVTAIGLVFGAVGIILTFSN